MARFTLVLVALLSAAHSATALAPLHLRHDGEDHGAPAASTTAPALPTVSPSTATDAHPPQEATPVPVASTTPHDHADPTITTTAQPAPQGTKPPSTSGHDHSSHNHSSSSSGTAPSSPAVTGGAGRALGRSTVELAWMGAMAVAVGGPLVYVL
jgi:hypothetical protein